jgi:hypothetical protein
MGDASIKASSELSVRPESVERQRRDFETSVAAIGDEDRRRLYESYLKVIGANGILDGIEKVSPKCHSEAHDAGKVIFAEIRDIGRSLRVCADRCFSGCMHGVLMEAFAGATPEPRSRRHVDLAAIKRVMNDTCYHNAVMISSYSPGDCAHGVGHALMVVTGYDIPRAVQACAGFQDRAMTYYCATGAYMEYVTERDLEDSKRKSLFYPCDTYDYPAACARYKMVHVVERHYEANKKIEDLVRNAKNSPGNLGSAVFTAWATPTCGRSLRERRRSRRSAISPPATNDSCASRAQWSAWRSFTKRGRWRSAQSSRVRTERPASRRFNTRCTI